MAQRSYWTLSRALIEGAHPIWLVGPRRTVLYTEVGAGGTAHGLNSCHSSHRHPQTLENPNRSRERSQQWEDSPTPDLRRLEVRITATADVIEDLLHQRRDGLRIDFRRPCYSFRRRSNPINPDLFICIPRFYFRSCIEYVPCCLPIKDCTRLDLLLVDPMYSLNLSMVSVAYLVGRSRSGKKRSQKKITDPNPDRPNPNHNPDKEKKEMSNPNTKHVRSDVFFLTVLSTARHCVFGARIKGHRRIAS
jgi:hypothetical protein